MEYWFTLQLKEKIKDCDMIKILNWLNEERKYTRGTDIVIWLLIVGNLEF